MTFDIFVSFSPSRWFFLSSGSVPTSLCVLSLWPGFWMRPVLSSLEWTPDTLTSMILLQMLFVWTWTPALSTCEIFVNLKALMKLYSWSAWCWCWQPNNILNRAIGLKRRGAQAGKISQRSLARVWLTHWSTCKTSLLLVRRFWDFDNAANLTSYGIWVMTRSDTIICT